MIEAIAFNYNLDITTWLCLLGMLSIEFFDWLDRK